MNRSWSHTRLPWGHVRKGPEAPSPLAEGLLVSHWPVSLLLFLGLRGRAGDAALTSIRPALLLMMQVSPVGVGAASEGSKTEPEVPGLWSL